MKILAATCTACGRRCNTNTLCPWPCLLLKQNKEEGLLYCSLLSRWGVHLSAHMNATLLPDVYILPEVAVYRLPKRERWRAACVE